LPSHAGRRTRLPVGSDRRFSDHFCLTSSHLRILEHWPFDLSESSTIPEEVIGVFTTVLLAASLTVLAGADAGPLPERGSEEPLVVLTVVDGDTGAAIEKFLTVPGVPYTGSNNPSVAAWQPHLAHESAGGRYEWPAERSYAKFRLRVEAEGYAPASTEWIVEADGRKEITIRLRRDPGIHGIVLLPDGSPGAGATLGVSLPNRDLRLSGRAIERDGEPPAVRPQDRWRQPITFRAGVDGRFRLPTEIDPAALLVVVHEGGYLERPFAELRGADAEPRVPRTLRLAAWGRITGRVMWGDRARADELVELIVSREAIYPSMVGKFGEARSDAAGRFEFENVPPGKVQLARIQPDPGGKEGVSYQFPVQHVGVHAGEATEVVLGGRGRVVTGHLTGLESFEGVTLRIHPRAPHIGFAGDDEQWQGWANLHRGPLGATVFRDAIPVRNDGTFQIEGLVPEWYQLFVNDGGKRLNGGTSFRLSPEAGGADGRRQDVGEIRVSRAAE
jgi:hypothetical protein